MPTLGTTVDLLSVFADPTRVRLVALLGQRELSVAEITAITELGQSRVSTHLGRLREAGVLRDRRVGAQTFYAYQESSVSAEARRIWKAVAEELRDTVLEADRRRCEEMVRAREAATPWADAVAGQMERHYSPGRTWESMARGLVGLMRLGDVLDVGGGDGSVAQMLASRSRSYTLFDRSPKMVAAARERLAGEPRASVIEGDMHKLPFADASFDQVLALHVLTVATTPSRVVAECARVLRPGGDLVLVTLDAHSHTEAATAYQHTHPGFTPSALRALATRAGLRTEQCGVTSRERRPPYFDVVSLFAHKPVTASSPARRRAKKKPA